MEKEFVLKTIEMLQGQIQKAELEIGEKRRTVNSLCAAISRPPVYADGEPSFGKSLSIRSDEFYGKPLATAVRAILEKRAAAGLGSASVYEIYDRMVEGGFRFGTKNEGHARRALAISMAKNTTTFHRLPNGDFGLTEWYPEASKEKNGKEPTRQLELGDEPYHNEFAEEAEDAADGQRSDNEVVQPASKSTGRRDK